MKFIATILLVFHLLSRPNAAAAARIRKHNPIKQNSAYYERVSD